VSFIQSVIFSRLSKKTKLQIYEQFRYGFWT